MLLIVDQNFDNLVSIRKIIELKGYLIDQANSEDEVLNSILKKSLSLIIMNVECLDDKTLSIIEIIRHYNILNGIPIIFLFNKAINYSHFIKDLQYGTIDYLLLPINFDQLILKINIFYRLNDQNRELKKVGNKLRQEATSRRQAQEEVRERIQYLHTILHSLPQITFKADYNGTITFVNEKWYEYSTSSMVFPEQDEDMASIQQKFKLCRISGCSLEYEVRIKHLKTNTFRYHLLRIIPIIENDKILKWVGTFMDIEDQKQIENKKEEFLSIASHELKTPLTSIKGYVQLLDRFSKKLENKSLSSLIDKTNNQIMSMEVLISDLLDLTRINNGKFYMNFQYFDLEQLIQNTIVTFNQMNSLLGITVIKEGVKFKQEIYGDKYKIEQVIINYLSNATKYAPGTNKIIVKTSYGEKNVQVEVVDFGIGISEERKSNLFKKFYRVDDTTVNYQGLGIGLYICAEIINQHKGGYGVKSILGEGSSFYFTLPIDQHKVC